jgi:nucleoside-diphosphate-sugar epimerase
MDNSRLRAVLGHEPHTVLEEAVEATLMAMGNLKQIERAEVAGAG